MLSGPREITKDATVAEMGVDGNLIILRQGTNDWICFPGDENEIGNVPMCVNPMGLQWMMDIRARKPKPKNTAPGLIYMLCGATQHSNTDPFDRTSPAIPIGPHWMIIWPYDAKRCGCPARSEMRAHDDGTPYATCTFAARHGPEMITDPVRSQSGQWDTAGKWSYGA